MRPILSLLVLFSAVAAAFAAGYAHADGKPKRAADAKAAVAAPDPTVSDGDKYHVILENEHVRVLRYHDEPGQKTSPHHHPNAFIMYALAPFRRKLVFPDGKVRERVFAAGDLDWVPAQTHSGENIGTVPTDGLLIEVKSCVPRDSGHGAR